MEGVRQALLFASVERYLSFVITFASVAVVSRILTPTEIGTAAIGMALITIAIALKEFAASGFLILGTEVGREDVRTAFTVQFVLTLVIVIGVAAAAPVFARIYREPMLAQFVRIMALALVLDTAAAPITALLRRDLAFGTLAIINVASLCASTVTTVALALNGFGFMSVAWAWLAATLTTVALSFFYRPSLWLFKPSLRAWRSALAFGGCLGATTVIQRLYETVPQLVLGRFLPLGMVGMYNRATMISSFPDKLILSGLFNIAFPALASEVRAGSNLKHTLLQAYCYITALYWPALAEMVMLAHPLVRLALGTQWDQVVPLVQIMGVATAVWFPVVLSQPLLLAIRAMRDAFLSNLIALPLSALVLCIASTQGVEVMAASQLVTTPFQMYIALKFVRRHVPFSWIELARAVRPSAIVTAFSVLPVLVVIGLAGFHFDLPLPIAITAGLLSAVGWLIAIRLVSHPVSAEIRLIVEFLAGRLPSLRVLGRLLTLNTG